MLSKLSPLSTVWFYLSETKLNESQLQKINNELQGFTACWDSHGSPLNSSFEIFENHLIVISVDASTSASGCSVDKLTHLIRKIESDINIPLFNRQLVLFQDKWGVWTSVSLNNFKEQLHNNMIDSETLVYDLTIHTLSDFFERGKVPVQKSWLKKYIPIVLT
jgi:hypothetical protein